MVNFFAIVFFRFKMVLKDDLSAMGIVTYLLSLNIFTLVGGYKCMVQHSNLSNVPLFYALLIMLVTGLVTRFIVLGPVFTKNMISDFKECIIAQTTKGIWLTIVYAIASFSLMLTVV